jgi:mRNA-degrading endonuclease HigB of HigAB toxin-antitoxin module
MRAAWGSLAAVRNDFAHGDVVGRRTVFNIHGNDYRLIARVNYRT